MLKAEQEALKGIQSDEVNLLDAVKDNLGLGGESSAGFKAKIHTRDIHKVAHLYRGCFTVIQGTGLYYRELQHPLAPVQTILVVKRSDLERLFDQARYPPRWKREEILPKGWYDTKTVARLLDKYVGSIGRRIRQGALHGDLRLGVRWVSGKEVLRLIGADKKTGLEELPEPGRYEPRADQEAAAGVATWM